MQTMNAQRFWLIINDFNYNLMHLSNLFEQFIILIK